MTGAPCDLASPTGAHPGPPQPALADRMGVMDSDHGAKVTALAINVTIPEALRWRRHPARTPVRSWVMAQGRACRGPGLRAA